MMSIDRNANKTTKSGTNMLTRRVTTNLAAGIITNADFPTADHVPDTIPMPFTNFGHQALIDHELLQTILWTTINRMQSVLKPWKKLHAGLVATNCIVSLVLFGALATRVDGLWVGIISSIASLILGTVLINRRTERFRKSLAKTKASELQKLLSDTWEPDEKEHFIQTIRKRTQYFGSGELGGDCVPVLTIVDDGNPFPGFGRLQAENTFTCRPKDDVREPLPSIDKIAEVLFQNVRKTVEASSITEVASGNVITVYGDSVTIGSKWLGPDKSPQLWIPRDQLESFLAVPDDASSRQYFAIQAVFPTHTTAATVFFRPFLSGNAASCHLAVSTIGPPILNELHVRKVLLRYNLEMQEKDQPRTPSLTADTSNDRLTAIRTIRTLTRDTGAFINGAMNMSALLKLNIEDNELSGIHKSEFDREFKQIVQQSTMWPASVGITNVNVRDRNSYTFVKDFYGKPEMLACVRTMYDQISRIILDSLDDLGFSISDYRDKEGHYSINADKIDSLVVGEKIYIEKKIEKAEPSQTVKEAKGETRQ